MKYSEITIEDVKEYLNAYEEDLIIIDIILSAAKGYVKSYTGLTEEKLNMHDDISIAVMALCTDMFDNRAYTVEKDKVNRVVKSILDMYSINLL